MRRTHDRQAVARLSIPRIGSTSATDGSSCPPVIRCFPPLVASWSTLRRSA
jgi:hypothetical protein